MQKYTQTHKNPTTVAAIHIPHHTNTYTNTCAQLRYKYIHTYRYKIQKGRVRSTESTKLQAIVQC